MLQNMEDRIALWHVWFKIKILLSLFIVICLLMHFSSLAVYSHVNNAGLDAVQSLLENDLQINTEHVKNYDDTTASEKLTKIYATVMWDYAELLQGSYISEEQVEEIINKMETEIRPLFKDDTLYKTCLNRVYFAMTRRADAGITYKVMTKYLLSYIYYDDEPFSNRVYVHCLLSMAFDFILFVIFILLAALLLSAIKDLYDIHKFSDEYYKIYSESFTVF